MRNRLSRWALAIAAACGLVTPPAQQPTDNAATASQPTARTRDQQREQSSGVPVSVTAGRQALGIIDAPDFRSYRTHVSIWVGRPRSRHGRQYGPRV